MGPADDAAAVLRPRSNLTNASWLWLFGRLRNGADARRRAARALGADGRARGGTERPGRRADVHRHRASRR